MPRIIRTPYAPFRYTVGSAAGDKRYIVPSGPMPLTGIAIAADSEIDIVDILPGGREDLADRIRVSVWRPYQGVIAPGTDLTIRPVRRVPGLGSGVSGPWNEEATSQGHPLLSLEWHYEGYPVATPRSPAPYFITMTETTLNTVMVPVMGRERVSMAIQLGTATGGPPTLEVFGYDMDANGNEIGSAAAIASPVLAAGGEVQYDLSVAPYDFLVFVRTDNGASAYQFNLAVWAYDGQIA